MTDRSAASPESRTLQRFHRAERRRRAWDALLDDAYAFALPHHDAAASGRAGGRRDREIFDNTAVQAVQWRRSRLHGQLFPPFREWMDFEAPESFGFGDDLRRGYETWLDDVRARFHVAIEASNFHIEVDPAIGDALISTGALMVHEGSFARPLRFEAIPARELVPEEGPDGMLATVFRQMRLTARRIAEKWPDADLPPDLAKLAAEKPDTEIELIEAVMADHPGGPADYELWCVDQPGADGENLLLKRAYAASPVIAFRMDKAPGEWMGRGPVLSVLADIKTANKVVELILKNASIAVTGIWQAEDDGVLNPANIRLVPGAIIPKAVGSAGLTPLDAPGRFDVSQIVLERLQETIRRGIMGPTLPPAEAGQRTAFEIDVRQQEFAAVELPMSLRLLTELDYPLARRVLAILSGPAMVGSPFHVEPFSAGGEAVRPKPTSPLIRLQDIAEAAEAQSAYLRAAQAFPDMIGQVVDRAGYLRHYLKRAGFPAAHLQDAAAPAAATADMLPSSP
ncbi:portal protein [Minwuia thermotolerans]|nr:portal protein [Minwuia thermotolerans]